MGLAVFVAALWAQGNVMVGVFYDDGVYVTAGKALAQGVGYRNIHLPGAPPIIHYPPLYPLVLSTLWRLWPSFPANVALFALADAAALGLAAWIAGRHLQHRLPQPAPLTLATLAAGFVSYPLLSLLGVRLSEPLFLLLTIAAVAVADRDAAGVADGLLAGALAGLATEVKTLGIGVLAGVVVALWLRRRRRAARAAAAAGALMVVPWMVWLATHPSPVDPGLANYTSYLSELREAGLAPVLAGLGGRGLRPIPEVLIPHWPPWLEYPVAALILFAFAWGVIRATRHAGALAGTLVAYFVIVSLWPFPPYRFVWILFPWVFALISAGCVAAWRLSGKRWPRLLVGIVLASIALGYLPAEVFSLWHRRFLIGNEGMTRSFRPLTTSIAAELPPGAVVASEDEALIYLYTGRHAVPSNLFRWHGVGTEALSPETHVRLWCEMGVTHLAVTAPADHASEIVQHLAARPDTVLTRLFQLTDGPGLYRFRCPG